MDFDMGEGAAALRTELRGLVGEHVPADFLGAFTDDPADLEIAQGFCRAAGRAGPAVHGVARGVRRPGRVAVGADGGPRGDVGPPRAPRRAVHGRQLGGPGDHAPRHRRAAAHAPAADRAGRGHLVPGLQRARRRLRPGVAADGGPARRRRLAHHRPEDLDLLRHDGPVVLPAGPHLAGREEAAGHHGLPGARWPTRRSRCGPIASMLGPHHLNEVFFDDLWVTEADVLGPVDEGWKVVQEVLAFERVGIARYARCERLLRMAPAVLGDEWDDAARRSCAAAGPACSSTAAGPACSPTGWWRCRTPAGWRRATPPPTASR